MWLPKLLEAIINTFALYWQIMISYNYIIILSDKKLYKVLAIFEEKN